MLEYLDRQPPQEAPPEQKPGLLHLELDGGLAGGCCGGHGQPGHVCCGRINTSSHRNHESARLRRFFKAEG